MLPIAIKAIIMVAIPTVTALVGYKKVKKLKKDWDDGVKKRRREIERGENPVKWL